MTVSVRSRGEKIKSYFWLFVFAGSFRSEFGYKFGGLISVIEGQATEEKLERELKNLINPDWDYHVKELDRNEFSAASPDQLSLNTFSKLTDVGLAIYGIKVKISKTNIDRAASSILHSTWIRIGGLPAFAKKEEVVKEVSSLVAEPLKVDSFVCLGMNQ